LSNIRQVNQIVQVVRCFRDDDIVHVENSVDPIRDIDIINSELIYADLEVVTRLMQGAKKGKQPAEVKTLLEQIEKTLVNSTPVHLYLKKEKANINEIQWNSLKTWNLLTAKPTVYVCNVSENDMKDGNDLTKLVQEYVEEQERKVRGKVVDTEIGEAKVLLACAKFEAEASLIRDPEERMQMLKEFGLESTGLQKIIRASFEQLGLITYYTVGEKETRGWTIREGTLAPRAAAEIHTDFEKGFIKADVINADEYLALGCDEALAKKKNKIRTEGKEYVVQDGDCMVFKFKS